MSVRRGCLLRPPPPLPVRRLATQPVPSVPEELKTKKILRVHANKPKQLRRAQQKARQKGETQPEPAPFHPGRLTQEQFEELSDHEAHLMYRCHNVVKNSFKDSRVNALVDYLRHKDMKVDPLDDFITVTNAPGEEAAAQFATDQHGNSHVLVNFQCLDKGYLSRNVTQSVRHELVHAVDNARGIFDFQDLRHHAVSEVRASNLSGECTFLTRMLRGAPFQSFNECVRQRAIRSVAAHPNCQEPQEAVDAVNLVFKRALQDLAPFVNHPDGNSFFGGR